MKKSRPLVIFTHFFPFGEKELFLETEVRYLKEHFSSIVIVPNMIEGKCRSLPEGVSVETSFAQTYRGKGMVALLQKTAQALTYAPLYAELNKIPKKRDYARKLLGYAFEAARCAKWLKKFLQKNPCLHEALFYTYWLYDHTSGILRLKKRYPGMQVISRAHGFDLYAEDYYPPYIPFRPALMEEIDSVFCISEHGSRYLCKKFSSIQDKIKVSRLGIEDPGFTIQKSREEPYVLVSCSHLVPLKRIFLQIDGVSAFARQYPHVRFEWHLIGDGSLKEQIHRHAAEKFPSSVIWHLTGSMNNQAVFAYYQKIKPDLFLLTSETEGLPVSLMEAYACGIPAVATDVGGVSEIVNAMNGRLLSANPSDQEIAQGIASLLLSSEKLLAARQAARFHWQTHFHAATNYLHFCDHCQKLSV
jgi:glycosyltransferase involved in cell wall biosynthesis